jgi:hypothetical protein
MEKREFILCPSARREPGAHLLGVVQPSGRVKFLPAGIAVDEATARLERPSEVQFRYSAPCRQSGCLHWRNRSCTALDEVREHFAPFAVTSTSSCGIRHQCLWYQQAGDAACAVCPLVAGELMALEEGIEPPEEEALVAVTIG